MILGGLQKTTLIDFPGRLAATVFLCGCNFRCPWCYSRELVLPAEIKKQPKVSERDFFNFLEERKGWLEGVVVCGGEPTIHKELPDFLGKIKNLGYLVKLDTNGSNPAMLKTLIDEKLVDYIAMDVKGPRERYGEFAGQKVEVKKIQESIDILRTGRVDYEFRTTWVPRLHTPEDILQIAEWIKGAEKYYLQNFRPEKTVDPEFAARKPCSEEYLWQIQRALSSYFKTVQIR